MIINIDAPVKQNEIIACLEANEEVKYKYLGKGSMRTQIQFEVEDKDNITAYTKAYIKSKLGNMVVFRVLEEGKNW